MLRDLHSPTQAYKHYTINYMYGLVNTEAWQNIHFVDTVIINEYCIQW